MFDFRINYKQHYTRKGSILMKRAFLLIILLLITRALTAQDLNYAHSLIDQLTAKEMWGRGYTNKGMKLAADFISSNYKAYGLKPLNGQEYLQTFYYPVNTFPGKMDVNINGKDLIPGKDFIVIPSSSGKVVTGTLRQQDSITFIAPEQRILVLLKDKLTWSVAKQQEEFTGIEVNKHALAHIPEHIKINIENLFIPQFEAANICGLVPGSVQPDSLIVFTAHYDHLGGMGDKTYFPGANDNASGVSFLLNLAKYYALNPQPYSIAFLCFGAEEAGLLGSKYFTENPLLDLSKIRMLINLDMVGTGEEGITVVNATMHPKEFAMLNQINESKKYLVKINSRGKAANSDHYFFSEKGIPSFFVYTQGGITAYHDIEDKPETLPLTAYQGLFKLFLDFSKELIKKEKQ